MKRSAWDNLPWSTSAILLLSTNLMIGTNQPNLPSSPTEPRRELRRGEAVIWYLDRSGFAVKTGNRFLIFDYYNTIPGRKDGPLSLDNGVINPSEIGDMEVYAFISHEHSDHFRREIFEELQNRLKKIRWVVTEEVYDLIRIETGRLDNITVIKPNEIMRLGDFQIQALRSTDRGVAYLLMIDSLSIYHGGDHAWWGWTRQAGTKEEREFKAELDKLKANPIDVAFLTVDPKLREIDYAGALYFVRTFRPKAVFPMHRLGEHFSESISFHQAVLELNLGVKPAKIMRRGQRFFFSEGMLKSENQ